MIAGFDPLAGSGRVAYRDRMPGRLLRIRTNLEVRDVPRSLDFYARARAGAGGHDG